MVDRYTSPPLELPDADTIDRADLLFYGIDHSSTSFEARVFLDAPDANHETPRDHPNCAGSFYIFGHGGCFGDFGHCDVVERDDPYDLRPPHQLLPATRILTITDVLARLRRRGQTSINVTVVAHAVGDNPNDVLAFDTIRLASYAASASPAIPPTQ